MIISYDKHDHNIVNRFCICYAKKIGLYKSMFPGVTVVMFLQLLQQRIPEKDENLFVKHFVLQLVQQ